MRNNTNQAIGIFDSGIGGTSIWKEIYNILPWENTVYLSDSKNAPYGQKSKNEIIELSIKNVDYLLKHNCKLIVVACNTATTNAIEILRNSYDIPFVGIEPAIKPAALHTKTNIIGILATKGTLNSKLFEQTSARLDNPPVIIEQIGEGLVRLIEDGKMDTPEMDALLRTYLIPMIQANVDHIVLGCTHYPYLRNKIQAIVGTSITIIDSGYAVANQTKKLLEQHSLLNRQETAPKHYFYTNKNQNVLAEILQDYPTATIEEMDF